MLIRVMSDSEQGEKWEDLKDMQGAVSIGHVTSGIAWTRSLSVYKHFL